VTASCCTDDDVGALEAAVVPAEACGLACDVTPCRSEARLEAVLGVSDPTCVTSAMLLSEVMHGFW